MKIIKEEYELENKLDTDLLALKFPPDKRKQDWANAWSRWSNKSRQEVIEMTNDMKSLWELEKMYREQRRNRKRGGRDF